MFPTCVSTFSISVLLVWLSVEPHISAPQHFSVPIALLVDWFLRSASFVVIITNIFPLLELPTIHIILLPGFAAQSTDPCHF